MKERPILFSAPMVRAILDGRKTMTRRAAPIDSLDIRAISDDCIAWSVKFSKPIGGTIASHSGGRFSQQQARSIIASQFCPYGAPGDRLWVRETWAQNENQLSETRMDTSIVYRADGEARALDNGSEKPWRHSIHMPRWASRITLEITGVRVERLQEISEADAEAEGIAAHRKGGWWWEQPPPGIEGTNHFGAKSARDAYSALWESINGAGAWAGNPWVWVIGFACAKRG